MPFSLTLPQPIPSRTAPFTKFLARLVNGPLTTRAPQALPVDLYPNPARTTVHLSAVPVGSEVQVLDAVGRAARTTLVDASGSISLQGVAPGWYLLRARDAQGWLVSGRLVVE